ncbi:hypothetical protein R3P38DRAFT_3363050 [Favolaschia claudopus]|uniref:Tetratricopeptide repeat protein 38 n=1 Tax=Favolaschia claudopus TaxID=2862362 RepID=A0AAW0AK25_9AGAR
MIAINPINYPAHIPHHIRRNYLFSPRYNGKNPGFGRPVLAGRVRGAHNGGQHSHALVWRPEYRLRLSGFDPQTIETTAIQHFRAVGDLGGEDRTAYLIGGLGSYYRQHDNNLPKTLKYYRAAKDLAATCNDVKTQCFAFREAAECMWQLGQYHEALAEIQEMRGIAKHHGLFYEEAQAIRVELLCRVSLGDLKPCFALCAEARALLALCSLQGGILDLALVNSDADVHYQKTEFAEARALYLTTFPQQPPMSQAYDRLALANIDIETWEDTAKIRQDLEAIKAIFESIAHPAGITLCEVSLAWVDIRDGLLRKGMLSLQRSLKETWGNDQEISILCLNILADIAYGLNNPWDTYKWAIVLLGFALKGKNRLAVHHALRCMADFFATCGDDDTAQSLLQTAFDGFTAMDVHRNRGSCAVRLGDFFLCQGERDKALQLWNIARECFIRSQQAQDSQQVDRRIANVRGVVCSSVIACTID